MKKSYKQIQERREHIINLLTKAEKCTLSVAKLAKEIDVSSMTIRRDLDVLEKMGTLERHHGQAELLREIPSEGDTENLRLENIKQAIAKKAASLILDNNTIFINSSSTAVQTVSYLTSHGNTIITNNIEVVSIEAARSTTVFLTGGEIRYPKEALVGSRALQAIETVNADIAIIGCSGLSAVNGITTMNEHESLINQAMIKNCTGKVILVADYRKIGKDSSFRVCDWDIIDVLITDNYSDINTLKEIEKMGVDVIQIIEG